MTLDRSKGLRADPEKTRAWQRRSAVRSAENARRRPRKPLPRRSAKKKAIDVERVEVRRVVIERDGETCFAGANGLVPSVRCASPSPDRLELELHEVVKRGRWAAGAVVPSNCRLLCQAHHDYTEDEVEDSTREGLLASAPPPRGMVERRDA
jgi:hypothetical protein